MGALFLVLLIASVLAEIHHITVGSFNVENLNVKKLNSLVGDEIFHILYKYDIAFVQEVMFVQNKTVDAFKRKMLHFECRKCHLPDGCLEEYDLEYCGSDTDYSIVVSPPQGKGLEQYIYMYKKDLIHLVDYWIFENEKNLFERPPFIFVYRAKPNGILIALVGVHIKPRRASVEIDLLPKVRSQVKQKWHDAMIVMMGDFNADYPYIALPKKSVIPPVPNPLMKIFPQKNKTMPSLIHDDSYTWLIDSMDTTVNPNRVATLDRIVVHRDDSDVVLPGSAKPFYYPFYNPPYALLTLPNPVFMDERWLEQGNPRFSVDEVFMISDHFPIEVKLFAYKIIPQHKPEMTVFNSRHTHHYEQVAKSQSNQLKLTKRKRSLYLSNLERIKLQQEQQFENPMRRKLKKLKNQ